ncbi:DUF4012 domain-containing protein [Aeromicrobium fastidiosum]|uniref:DUF4012 domain-containing protein n=1 Tax=Aeromicrobium fastidiosum TaxID=52699 RepID=A0A641AUD7_9ACTN|nr:DUF4012 domain-containing protein [Aeromicrobium fastidiosum]KAA1380468.1 DUF4012 domain-containing protein [Aeromicrobium fastidiosum]MBP2390051.1 hypothetical protein [Aeromicrobium fastidiosum]
MSSSRSAATTNKSPRRRTIILGVLGLLLVVAASVAVYGYSQLSSARDDIDVATASASDLQSALESGDQAAAKKSLDELQQSIGDADSTLSGALFSVAAKLPVAGKNVNAVRTVTSSLRTVADDGLPPLVDIADQFNGKTFNPTGGSINVAAIAAIGPNVTASSRVIDTASADVNAIDSSTLAGSLRGPVEDVQDKLTRAATIARRATTASDVVPQMLTGKHTYLLIFQNNAEIRATGGLPGAYAVLDVDDGKISLGQQGSGASMGDLPYKATPISAEESDLFDTKLVSDFRDVNFTPDFPRAAEIGTAILAREKGIDVDGVLSVDPVTLSYVLKGIGPIELEDGSTLTSSNAVDVLLNGVYVNYPEPGAQDAFFASATQKIFDKVLAGQGDPTALLKALTRAANERRVQVWTKDTSITDELGNSAVAGKLPTGKAADSALGIYLNDATGAKMQYYLDYDIAAKATKCSAAGVQTYETTTTLTSSAPADSAQLPESIRGPGFGAEPGSMLLNYYLYAPNGGKVTALTIDGEDAAYPLTQDGRGVDLTTVQLDPGQTVTVKATVVSGKGQRGSTQVLATPSIKPGSESSVVRSAC